MINLPLTIVIPTYNREAQLKKTVSKLLSFGNNFNYELIILDNNSDKDLNFYFSTKDSSTYFNNNFSYAHSANFKLAKVSDIYHWITKPALGLDLGLVYEWRPDFQNFKYKPDGKNNLWRKDANKYKLKFGASLMDVGKIKFNKDGKNYDLDVHVQGNIFTKYSKIKKD